MTELTEITGVGGSVASSLKEQGIESAEDLADADPSDIEVPTGNPGTLIRRASESTISRDTMADVLDNYETKPFYPTGIDRLDETMGGGLESGTIGLCYGKSGKGKTQVAFSSIAAAAAEGSVVYVQTENQSDAIAERVATMAEDPQSALSNIHRYEAYSVEDQYATYGSITDDFEERGETFDLLVIDSFTAQFRVTDRFSGRENLGERSEVIGKHLQRISSIVRQHDAAAFLVGQVYDSPSQYEKGDTPWGGEKLKHFVSYYIRMSEGQGELKKATLENHPGRAEEEVPLYISEDGIDEAA